MWDELAIPVGGKTASTAFCGVVLAHNLCSCRDKKDQCFSSGFIGFCKMGMWTEKEQCVIVMCVVLLSLRTWIWNLRKY